jgi:hypothetical protein
MFPDSVSATAKTRSKKSSIMWWIRWKNFKNPIVENIGQKSSIQYTRVFWGPIPILGAMTKVSFCKKEGKVVGFIDTGPCFQLYLQLAGPICGLV